MTKALGWFPLLSQVAFLVLIAIICLPVGYDTPAGGAAPQAKAEIVLTTPVEKPPTGQVPRDEASAILPKTYWDWRRETRTREFYILGLNEKHLRLLHYIDGECEEAQLPDAVPKSAEAAGAFDVPDHTLRDRSGAGQLSGSQSAVVFGTGPEREKAHERLYECLRLVDRGLSKAIGGQPLLLSGVGYWATKWLFTGGRQYIRP